MPEADTAVGMFKKDEEKLKKKTLQNVTHIQNQSIINRFKVEVQ